MAVQAAHRLDRLYLTDGEIGELSEGCFRVAGQRICGLDSSPTDEGELVEYLSPSNDDACDFQDELDERDGEQLPSMGEAGFVGVADVQQIPISD